MPSKILLQSATQHPGKVVHSLLFERLLQNLLVEMCSPMILHYEF